MKAYVTISSYDQSDAPKSEQYEGQAKKGGRINVVVELEGEETLQDLLKLSGKIQSVVDGTVKK